MLCKWFGHKLKTVTTVQNIEVLYKQYTTTEVVCLRCGAVVSKDTVRTIQEALELPFILSVINV